MALKAFPSFGTTPFLGKSGKVIRLIRKGCTNRPFYHISVQEFVKEPQEEVIEQIGNYDPLPNKYNEKLVAINFQRLEYWLRQGVWPTTAVNKILGLSGYFPVHGESLKEAFLHRKLVLSELTKLRIEASKICPKEISESNKSTENMSDNISETETPLTFSDSDKKDPEK